MLTKILVFGGFGFAIFCIACFYYYAAATIFKGFKKIHRDD